MALKGHLIAGGLVGPLAGIESGSANDLVGFNGSAVAGTRSLSNLLDAVIGDDAGTIAYRDSSSWKALAPADGYLNSASGVLTWASLPPTTGRLIAGTPLSLNPVTNNSVITQAHGLGVVPDYVRFQMENLTADVTYSPGDIVTGGSTMQNVLIFTDATNLKLVTQNLISVTRQDTHSGAAITLPSWKMTLTPYKLS